MTGFPEVETMYAELRRMARFHTRRSRVNPTIQPTMLVHEAWLRLMGRECRSRTHYLALASKAMRHFLIDYGRGKQAQKRAAVCVPLEEESAAGATGPRTEGVDIERLLDRLGREDPRKARVVEMLFFDGMDFPEVAAELKVSVKTVARDWQFCRAWLFEVLCSGR